MIKLKEYNTAIIGGGASGILAGIYLDDKKSTILEKNEKLGKKILITGGGRCNITNNSTLNEYTKNYYNSGNYYRSAFNLFFNKDIINLLEDNGCKTKIEEDNRVFPITDSSKTVLDTLIKILDNSKTQYKLNCNVTSITKEENFFIIQYNSKKIKAKNVILATGGNSYPETGSTGDGKKFAVALGHTKTKNMGGLSPIKIQEQWIKQLQGITLDVSLEFKANKKSIIKDSGSILFTHKGLSGFVIMNNSMTLEKYLRKNQDVKVNIDLVPEYNYETLDKILQEDFKQHANQGLKRYLHKYLPKNMVVIFLEQININPETILNQVTKKERVKIRDFLKRITLTVTAVLENESRVTNSGIKRNEINPNSFESKIVSNLYIVGELIEGCGICGGYNLQKAFSTGVLAATTIKEVK
ncbi:NAD(P)/FAD-dependent oxidoreductase [Methanosphaera sp. WGK6]|uniref:NAD(P)/FAD-dependent oxidoreductase n=1 Tax=Methanosphaera sp. WGK6 TaxID=1561964 RepID=UPI00130184F6|nr:NAD(P)/FAD-dependent oxidoreductase [Methanosphaera sp. WGK6]